MALLLYDLWQPPSRPGLVLWPPELPHRDCPHPRSQVCWHSYLAPAPKRFQFFSEDLGHRSGSPRGSELQTCLAKGNHANQKNSTLKPLLNLPVELGHRCDPVLESGCASVYWRVVWEQG